MNKQTSSEISNNNNTNLNSLNNLFSNMDLGKNPESIHINSTSNINITVVTSGNIKPQDSTKEQGKGFSFVNKSKNKVENNETQEEQFTQSQPKKNVDISDLLNKLYEGQGPTNVNNMPVPNQHINNNSMYNNVQNGFQPQMYGYNQNNNVMNYQIPYNPNSNQLSNNTFGYNQNGYGTGGLYYPNQGGYPQSNVQINNNSDIGLSKKIEEEINPNKKDNKFSFVDDLLKPKNK